MNNNCPLGVRKDLEIVRGHKRSLVSSRRSVPPSLPPSVGQRGRPRVAGAERNTTPRQRKGVIERRVSEWKKKSTSKESGERKNKAKLHLIFHKWFCCDCRRGAECGAGIDRTIALQQTGYNSKVPAFLCSATDHAARLIQTSTCAIQACESGFFPGVSGNFHKSRPREHIEQRKSFRRYLDMSR